MCFGIPSVVAKILQKFSCSPGATQKTHANRLPVGTDRFPIASRSVVAAGQEQSGAQVLHLPKEVHHDQDAPEPRGHPHGRHGLQLLQPHAQLHLPAREAHQEDPRGPVRFRHKRQTVRDMNSLLL